MTCFRGVPQSIHMCAFCERHYGVTEKDITLFSGLIGTFDLYDFALAGKQVDTYGFRAKEMAKLNIDSYDFLLQPCPVNQTDSKKNANIFRYRMFQDICPRTEEEKENTTKLIERLKKRDEA